MLVDNSKSSVDVFPVFFQDHNKQLIVLATLVLDQEVGPSRILVLSLKIKINGSEAKSFKDEGPSSEIQGFAWEITGALKLIY